MPFAPDIPDVPLAAIRDAAFLYGPDAVVSAATPAAEELAGGPLAGAPIGELVRRLAVRAPGGPACSAADLPECRALAGEDAPPALFAMTAADGTARTVLVSASPIVEDSRIAGAFSVWRDVTVAARAEEALAESEADARSFMANMVDACAVCETVGNEHGEPVDIRLVEVNPAFARELGLPAELLVGRTAFMILPALARPWFDLFLEVSRTRRPIEVEEPFPALGRWYHVTAFPVRRGRIAVVFRNITDRRQAQQVLAESEERYRRFFDDDITGDFVSTPDGRILDCNPAFARMFGFASVEEALSSNMVETYIDSAERDELLDRLRRGRRLENNQRFRRRRDGTRIHVVENIIGVFDDGKLAEIRGYIIEDTQRYRAEASLRERERTLQGIFRAAPVGIGTVSDRTITGANDRLCRMTGYSCEELIGHDARLLYPSDEAYEYVGREKYARMAESGIGAVETQWRRRDGTVFDVLLSSSVIDPSNPRENVIFIALDITKLHESERGLAAYAENLKRSNEELQRFAYVASHDLQEPLRSIISFSQLLDRRYSGRLGQDADDYIRFIVEGGMRMQTLIQDLLQLSRIETRAQPPVPTDANEVAADVIRSLRDACADAGAAIAVEPLPTVMADPTQLEQVFSNLIGNAIKYRRPEVPLQVRVSARRRGRMVEFAVADNGIGIEAQYFDRVFEMFRRLHTKEAYPGTGIGLAVVKKIVERHGGAVRVESTPGEGSTFYFSVPAAD